MKHRADVVALDDGARGVGRSPGRHAAPAQDEIVEPPCEQVLAEGRWRRRHLGRTLLGIAALATLGLIVPKAVGYWQVRSTENLQELMVAITLGIGLLSILTSCPPQQVTLHGSLLRVHAPGVEETFDLADALQRVELSGRAGKRDWQLTFGRPDDRDLVLGRRDVDSRALDPVVRRHRSLAERRRHREWARLGLRAGV